MSSGFLELPERSVKPRQVGLTHVLDRGLSVAEVDGLIEVVGTSVDIVKLGWGTALATGNLDRKLARYREHGIPTVLGGSLTELAIAPTAISAPISSANRRPPVPRWRRAGGLGGRDARRA